MNKLLSLISKGDARSVKAKRNIVYSFAFKAVDAIVYFLIVPATLGYLDKYSYGIWLTLNSILMWINTFDVGLGNGMRNCCFSGKRRKRKITNLHQHNLLLTVTYSCICLRSIFRIKWYNRLVFLI